MITLGTKGKISFCQAGEWIDGVIDSWASASMICVKMKDGSMTIIEKKNVRLRE